MTIRNFIVLLALIQGWHVHAAEPQADDDEDLGRVFMSAEQRAELDRLRKIRPATVESGGPAMPTADVSPDPGADASGFIIRAEGEAYLWMDGDFKKVRPGTVNDKNVDKGIEITRHEQLPAQSVRNPAAGESTDDDSR